MFLYFMCVLLSFPENSFPSGGTTVLAHPAVFGVEWALKHDRDVACLMFAVELRTHPSCLWFPLDPQHDQLDTDEPDGAVPEGIDPICPQPHALVWRIIRIEPLDQCVLL